MCYQHFDFSHALHVVEEGRRRREQPHLRGKGSPVHFEGINHFERYLSEICRGGLFATGVDLGMDVLSSFWGAWSSNPSPVVMPPPRNATALEPCASACQGKHRQLQNRGPSLAEHFSIEAAPGAARETQ